MTQLTEQFEREDVVFCPCCGQFLNTKTNLPVEISYDEMPANFVIEVMLVRKGIATKFKVGHHRKKVARKRYRFDI